MQTEDDPPEPDPTLALTAVVLAAGRGTRMRSERPKVLHPLCGRAIAAHVLHALAESGVRRAVVVIPPDAAADEIRAELDRDIPAVLELAYAVQPAPLGTADAVRRAQPHVCTPEVLVVNGDLALLSPEQLRPLLQSADSAVSILTAEVDEPAQMGRIVRGPGDELSAIVEWRKATEAQRRIQEVNVGVYRFDSEYLWSALDSSAPCTDAASERYVTDVIALAAREGRAEAISATLPDGRLNVETLLDAANAEATLRRRACHQLLANGVRITDPAAVWIDARASIAAHSVIEPGSHIRGRTIVGARSTIGPAAVLEDAAIGEDCRLESCTIRDSTLANRVEVGPYSTIRPGCKLGEGVHIGTHAELKNARLDAGVQVGHFSYLGDTDVGARANIGAGAITCNFDGERKHNTQIGEDAFIGSDTLLVAPIRVGPRARTGAGSVVTRDVPPDANVVGSPARMTAGGRPRRPAASQETEASL